MLKTEARGRGFQHIPRDLSNVNALKNHVRSRLLHINYKHLSHFVLFLALFWFAFSPMSREHNARSRAGQYTSRDGRNPMALVQSYWKLPSCALTVRELPCNNMFFSLVNARMLIMCHTAFYAIIVFKSYQDNWKGLHNEVPHSQEKILPLAGFKTELISAVGSADYCVDVLHHKDTSV